MSRAATAVVRRDRDAQTPVVLVLAAALAAFALWRVRQGIDHGDGAHVVAQAVRLARGAVPFVDEMNAQALGALAAVPFTWVWLHLVGLEGIVLASRVWYLVLAFAVGTVGYRALRTGLRPLPAFTAVALACTPTAYNLLVTSYNTMPGLALGLATFAGYAALTGHSGRWAVVSGVALAFAVLSHPSSLPGAAVLAILVLVLADRRPGVVRGLLLGGGGLSLMVVLWVLLEPGASAVLETLEYTADYQASRPHPLARLADTAERHAAVVASWAFAPALVLAVIASLPRLPDRWRAVALVAVPAGAALPAALSTGDPTQVILGATSGSYAVLVVLVLVVPVSLWAMRAPSRNLLVLLVLSLPPAAAGLVTYAMATSATAHWGAVVPPAAPLYGVLGLGVVLVATEAWGEGKPHVRAERQEPVAPSALAPSIAVMMALLPLLGVHTLHSFRDPAPWIADVPVMSGPNAGLFTSDARAKEDCDFRLATAAWVGPGESVLAYAAPAVYLYTDGPMATNIVWLASFGEANRTTVDWLDERDAWPDVVTVLRSVAESWDQHAVDDPLLQRLSHDYGDPVAAGRFSVLRRDGATTPPGPPADLSSCAIP